MLGYPNALLSAMMLQATDVHTIFNEHPIFTNASAEHRSKEMEWSIISIQEQTTTSISVNVVKGKRDFDKTTSH
ncbi:hypothetical protein V1477_017075 [Vespula maculifrons]|uniref:Uncharacterized protein n=1 Tax=Vespula maculifrons TaxID=7453 RepID=A0ABD2B4Z5_VESMC